jgi:ABC-2 type transport system ATP-binding protein
VTSLSSFGTTADRRATVDPHVDGHDGLRVEGLRVEFAGVVAVDDVSLRVEPGQVVGFLGPNGSGKTTTMRAILGLLTPQRGTVSWAQAPITDNVRKRIGYMPEERGLYLRMKTGEQVAYFGQLAGLSGGEANSKTACWLDRLGLSDRIDSTVQDLSHGNQQRVQLAVALVHDPELLVLDEPFSGLDPVAVKAMSSIIAERAAAGAAVLFSSHQLDLVEQLCEDVVILEHGRVRASGRVSDLRGAAPSRILTIALQPATSWAPVHPDLQVIRSDAGAVVVRIPRDADLAALLAQASQHGTVSTFSFEPPPLSDVFAAMVQT